MPARNHKSVRMDATIRRLITARMIAENCDESAAIRSLIHDGANAPRPRPVLAQLGSPADLKKFFDSLLQWQQDFQSVRARLAMADPDPKDTQLCARVAAWRKLADELEPKARKLAETADAMAKALMGLTPEDCAILKQAKQTINGFITQRETKLKKTDLTPDDRAGTERVLKECQGLLKALEIFSV